MKMTIIILSVLVYSVLTLGQIDTTAEQKARARTAEIQDNEVRLITLPDFRKAFTDITSLAVEGGTSMSVPGFRLDETDTAGAIQIVDGINSGTFFGESSNIKSNNDSIPISKTVSKKYFLQNDGAVNTQWLTSYEEDTFFELVANWGSKPSTVIVDKVIPVTSNRSIPSNIKLQFENGGSFNISNGVVLSIYNEPIAGNFQIFQGLGNVAISGKWNEVLVDWFGAKGDSVNDDSTPVQRAVNTAYNNNLLFSKNKTYRFVGVFLPLEIKIDLNQAIIKPFKSSVGFLGVFNVDPQKVSPNLGYWINTNFVPSKSSPRRFKSIEIFNGSSDGEGMHIRFFTASASYNYSSIDDVYIHDMKIRNYTNSSISCSGMNVQTKVNGFINKFRVENSEFLWNGGNLGLLIDADHPAGTEILNVKTEDSSPISDRIVLGRFIRIGSAEVILEDPTTSLSTNAVYRIISFQTGLSADKGTITIQAGTYSSTAGFIANSSSPGLKTSIVKYSWCIPLMNGDATTITTAPLFSGSTGATTITRASTSSLENAYSTMLYPGMRFSFASGGAQGVYTIQSINPSNGSITISPALAFNTNSIRMIALGAAGPSILINGDIKNTLVSKNYIKGGSHAIQMGGLRIKGGYNSNLDNYVWLDKNQISYCWMSVESFTGPADIATISPFAGMSVSAGQNSVVIPNAAKFKVIQKDLDLDGTDENVLVGSSTSETSTTAFNSIHEGDIFYFKSVLGRYRITNIPKDFSTNPVIGISLINPINKLNVADGISNTVLNVDAVNRVFSVIEGQNGTFKQLKFTDNNFSYNLRSSEGYHISVSSEEVVILSNVFENCQRKTFEVSGISLQIKNNIVRQFLFKIGGKPMPSVTSSSEGGTAGAGGFALLSGIYNVDISGNTFENDQVDATKYNSQTGKFSISNNSNYLGECQTFNFQNNTVKGIGGLLFFPISQKNIAGVNYSTVNYKNLNVNNNVLYLLKGFDFSLKGLLIPFAITANINKNIIVHNESSEPSQFNVFNVMPNPEMIGSGPYNYQTSGNIYPSKNVSVIRNGNLRKNITFNNDVNKAIGIKDLSNTTPTKNTLNTTYGVFKAGTTVYFPNISGGAKSYIKLEDSASSGWNVRPTSRTP